MAQFDTLRNKLLTNNSHLYEVVMVSGQAGPSIYVDKGNLNAGSDAFGRQRVASPVTLFDSHNILTQNNLFSETTAGSGSSSYVANTSSVNMGVSDVSGDEVVRQSYRRFSYQPGKSLQIMSTFVFNSPKANLRQRIGYFDEENGIFLEQSGSDISINMRSYVSGSASDTPILKEDWSVDPLDGTGPSALTLDLTKSQIFWIDLEWLGVGSVRSGFVINGQFIVCHIFHNANQNANVYMTTPNLPIRYEITNIDGTSGSSTLKQICSTVISEGGYDARALERSIGSASIGGVSIDTAYENLVTIRLRDPGYIVIPAGADLLNVSNTDFEWALFKNATPSSSLTYANATDKVEYSVTTTTFSSTGTRIGGGYLGGKTAPVSLGKDGFDFEYQLGSTIGGTSDTITLAAKAKSPSSSIAGILKWFEI